MSLKSLISSGTKVWLDSVDPAEVKRNRAMGISGATSNPIIIADIIKAGHYDQKITEMADGGKGVVLSTTTDADVGEYSVVWP